MKNRYVDIIHCLWDVDIIQVDAIHVVDKQQLCWPNQLCHIDKQCFIKHPALSQIQNRIVHKFNLNFIISIMKFVYIQAQFMFYCEMWPSRGRVFVTNLELKICAMCVRVRCLCVCMSVENNAYGQHASAYKLYNSW